MLGYVRVFKKTRCFLKVWHLFDIYLKKKIEYMYYIIDDFVFGSLKQITRVGNEVQMSWLSSRLQIERILCHQNCLNNSCWHDLCYFL